MKTVAALLTAALLVSGSSATMAAATQDGAAAIQEALQAYLTDTPGVVAVTPSGDQYAITLDLAPLFAKLPGKDVSISVSPLKFTAADNGGGKWKVDQDQAIDLAFKAAGTADVSMHLQQIKGSGIFDEALGAFESSSGDATGFEFKESITPEGQGATNVNYHLDSLHYESANKADGTDTVSTTAHISTTGISETFNVPANPATSTPAMDFTLTAEATDQTLTGAGLKAKPLMALVAFLVDHPSQETLVRDQDKLKESIRAALPLFNSLSMTGSVNNTKIATAIGEFGIPKMTVGVDLNGIVKDGKAREMVSVEGLTTPPGVIPPFATDFVPNKLTLDFNASGFDLASPAALMLDKADFSKTPPLPPELEVELGKLALPKGVFTIGVGPSEIINSLADLKFSGSMDVNPAMAKDAIPPAHADVSLMGFDKLMAAIQGLPKELGASQVMPVLMLVKGMAKAESDGSLTWHVETDPSGKVLVNGTDLSKIGGGG